MKKRAMQSKSFRNKDVGALGYTDMQKMSNKVIYWVMFTILVLIAMICVLPPLWILISSFKTTKELLQIPATLFPESWNIDKFIRIWKNQEFGRYYLNSLIDAAGRVVFSIICNGLAGYVISCLKPRGSALFATLILWTMLLPSTLSMVPLYMNVISMPIVHWNLSNTFLPMWFCSGASAFTVLLYRNFFDGISKSLTEAARLDGCGRFKVFTRIVMPLSMPIIAVDVIFTVSGAWGDFLLPYLVLNDKKMSTVMIAIYNMKNSTVYSMDEQFVGIVFAIIPPIIIFFFLQKYIMGGLSIGGVKE